MCVCGGGGGGRGMKGFESNNFYSISIHLAKEKELT